MKDILIDCWSHNKVQSALFMIKCLNIKFSQALESLPLNNTKLNPSRFFYLENISEGQLDSNSVGS